MLLIKGKGAYAKKREERVLVLEFLLYVPKLHVIFVISVSMRKHTDKCSEGFGNIMTKLKDPHGKCFPRIKNNKKLLEMRGIDHRASHMLSERSSI